MTVVIFDLSTGISEAEEKPEPERRAVEMEDSIYPVTPELSIVEIERPKEDRAPIPVLTGMVS